MAHWELLNSHLLQHRYGRNIVVPEPKFATFNNKKNVTSDTFQLDPLFVQRYYNSAYISRFT